MTDLPPTQAACPACNRPDVQINKDGTLRKHKQGAVNCPGGGQPIGEYRIPRRSNAGFYKCHTTGELLRSVTTILNQGSPKEALIHWAGKLVAETAMEHLPQLVRASRHPEQAREMTDWLKRAHTRKKEERADLGTAVHNLIEAKVLKSPIPDSVANDLEMRPYVANFEQFVNDWQITFTASEMVVADYDHKFAGTLDYLVRSPLLAAALGCPADMDITGDTKTGGELDARTYDGNVHGVYPEAGVQMSAYRKARYGWMRDGTRVEMPPRHDVGVVLHLRPEGYRLYPVRCGDDVFEAFTFIRRVAEFQTGPAKNIVGPALKTPSVPARKVA
ncbi:hypothetical protein [Nonomuraea rhizosphaerae]|uniref:hypothetical protein n=1 Tax=Nonomuraea rhizosphaerae TaxID=2665663 RepID=UPI001C5E2CAC|nr:hypothetical protein [Nonomuraea rhizosphaerae]